MRILYYLYGVFTFFFWSFMGFFTIAHLHGMVGYKSKTLVDDIKPEELDKMIEEQFDE